MSYWSFKMEFTSRRKKPKQGGVCRTLSYGSSKDKLSQAAAGDNARSFYGPKSATSCNLVTGSRGGSRNSGRGGHGIGQLHIITVLGSR